MPIMPEMGKSDRWAELVTDGHVRSARFRWLRPWLVMFAIASIILGAILAQVTSALLQPKENSGEDDSGSAVHNPDTRNHPKTLAGIVAEKQAPVTAAWSELPRPQLTYEQMQQLPPAGELPAVASALLKGLDATGAPPSDIQVTKVDASTFWRKPWPASQVVITQNKDVLLVGVIANSGSVDYPTMTRWLGVFKKKEQKWRMLSATGADFITIPDQPTADLTDIPMTLSPVLPFNAKQDDANG